MAVSFTAQELTEILLFDLCGELTGEINKEPSARVVTAGPV
jgi:hypothetical protein